MNIKKLLIFSPLILILLFSSGFAQNENNDRLTSEAVLLLDKLDIIQKPEDAAEFDNNVSRAEFAIYAGNVLNINSSSSDKRFYTDVSSTHWAAKSINTLTEIGIFTGSDNAFRPSDYITKAEACAVLVRLTGHDIEVTDKTRVENYISVARKNDILKNVTNENITLYDVEQMLFNTLNVTPIDKTISGDDVNYESVSGETILSQWFKVEKSTGILNAVKEGSVVPDKTASDEKVLIGDTIYKCAEDVKNLLGREVYVYYSENSTEKESILIIESGKSKVKTLEISDITYKPATKVIEYYENDKIKSITLPTNITVLRNYENVSKDISDVFASLHNGMIKVTDSDGNGSYDCVLIDDYENFVVKNVSSTDKKIYDKIVESAYVDVSEVDYLTVYDPDKNIIDFNKITENDVLSVYRSENYCEIYISRDVASGAVTSISKENGKAIFQIGERKFTTDRTYSDTAKNVIGIGISVDVYVNACGECVYVVSSKTTDFAYAYVMGSAEDGVFDKTLSLKLFTDDNAVKIYKCAETVKVDDVSQKTFDAIKSALANGNNGRVNYQLIRYKLNSDSLISEIDTIGVQNKNGMREIGRKEVGYINTSAQIGNCISLNNNTKVFIVPTDNSTEKSNEEAYQCSGMGYFAHGSTYEHEGIAYIADDSDGPWCADVILYKEDIVGGKNKEPNITKYIVKNVENFVAEDESIKNRLVLMAGKTEVKLEEEGNIYTIADDANIKVGNVISVKVDGYNRVIQTDLCYGKTATLDRTALTNCLYRAETTGFSTKGEYGHYVSDGAYGRFIVKGIANNLILFNGADTTSGAAYSLQKPITDNIAVYDTTDSKNPVRAGGLSDLYDAMYNNETVIPSINIGTVSAIAIIKTK